MFFGSIAGASAPQAEKGNMRRNGNPRTGKSSRRMADARCELSASQVGTGNAGNAEIGRPADTARHIAFPPVLAFTAISAISALR